MTFRTQAEKNRAIRKAEIAITKVAELCNLGAGSSRATNILNALNSLCREIENAEIKRAA